jgi:hypothetical protein
MHCPTQSHWQALKRLLLYLKSTIYFGIHIQPQPHLLFHAYSDADWAGNPSGRTSTSGYLLYFGNTPINWSSKKQRTIARSSTEAEYRAVCDAPTRHHPSSRGIFVIFYNCVILLELDIRINFIL